MATQSSLKDAFSAYADYLNDLNEKRERVVKASRDITMNSKKVIFQVHRISKNNKEEVLEKAHNDLAAVMNQYIARLVKELQGSDFWKLRRAYSPGIQEYVEAATLCRFCKSGTLLNLEEMNASLSSLSNPSHEPLQINILDYILGLADLTGELMRLAIGRISDGELEFAGKICKFMREIHRELTLLVPHMDEPHDMKTKMETMLQSVMKIENDRDHLAESEALNRHFTELVRNFSSVMESATQVLPHLACFSVHVRGSEYIPLLGTDDPSYPLMGVAEGIDL